MQKYYNTFFENDYNFKCLIIMVVWVLNSLAFKTVGLVFYCNILISFNQNWLIIIFDNIISVTAQNISISSLVWIK